MRLSAKQYQQLIAGSRSSGDPERRLRGKQNREMGEMFEAAIDAACEYYSRTNHAEIEKTPEGMKRLERMQGGRFICCFLPRSQPDYKGTLQGGRAVNFEAKHTVTDRIEASRLKPEQINKLNRHAQLGSVCFVILGFSYQDFYRVPWDEWKEMADRKGHRYVTPAELEEHRIPGDMGMVLFLDGLENRNE